MTRPTHPTIHSTIHPSGKLDATQSAHFSGMHADILLGGTDAPFTVMAMTIDPGLGGPAHISHREDKVFHVTGGRLAFLVGTRRFEVAQGDSVLVERGIIHGFTALDGRAANMILVSSPAWHDAFFRAMDGLPTPHRMEDVEEVCRRFDQEIVGPVIAP